MEAQKENVYLNAGGGGVSKNKLSTPQNVFVIHEDLESLTGKKSLKERSSDKKRRVLGDISNKQRDRQRNNNSDDIASSEKSRPGESLERPTKLSAKKKTKTPLKTKAGASLESKTGITPPRVEEVPNIESAYGGLSSPTSDSTYLKDLHDEIIQDILNDETPTLFDDFSAAPAVDDWSDEKAMLESGKPPSSWWSKELEKTDFQEKVEEEYSVFDDVPPPDDLSSGSLGSLETDGLLEDILSVDVEAVCTE
ncbi:unnamed protein product [Peronospora farinosa]|uniref:Uncharacterized protein n=1 Tax=Peronospora farinosa TaxID=134698 RepID=A0ABN8C2C1_9STRA|nr:unnamed protein product [Peronospora farinosa]